MIMENPEAYQLFRKGDIVRALPAYEGFFGWDPLMIVRVDGALVFVNGLALPWPQDCFVLASKAEPHHGRDNRRKRNLPNVSNLGGGSVWLR